MQILFYLNGNLKKDLIFKVHHTGIFYKIDKYKNDIKKEIDIDEKNDDSKGAQFYKITDLKRNNLSKIAIMEIEKLGYNLD